MFATRSFLFRRPKPVVAVVHVGPTPGVNGGRPVRCAVDRAVAEARLLIDLGVDGLQIENTHDAPALSEQAMGPEVTAYMTRVAVEVRRHAGRLPVGVRVLEGGNRVALAVAHAAGLAFVRVDRWTEDPAGPGALLRYRAALGADDVRLFGDLRPRPGMDVPTHIAALEEAGADGIVVLPRGPGQAPDEDDIETACARARGPVFIGGGITVSNFEDYVDRADGFVIGSGFKEGGYWRAPVCERRVRQLIGAVEYARGQEVRQ